MKQVLYYVLKYEDQYYAPYQSMQAFMDTTIHTNVLTFDAKLAIRFGTKEVANFCRDEEVRGHQLSGKTGFDSSKCRVVAVVKKSPNVH